MISVSKFTGNFYVTVGSLMSLGFLFTFTWPWTNGADLYNLDFLPSWHSVNL